MKRRRTKTRPKRSVLFLCGAGAALSGLLALPVPAAEPGRTQPPPRPADAPPEGLAASDWAAIRGAYEAHRHAAFPVEGGGYTAGNPGQQWRTHFDARGFRTEPDGGGWQWGLELRSYGFAREERAISGEPEITSAGQRVTYAHDEVLEEWFVNDGRGLEHGFTVKERPHDGAVALNSQPSTLNFLLAVRGGLRPELSPDGLAVRFLDEAGNALVHYSGLKVWDAEGKGLPARFEPADEGILMRVDERGARYPITIDPIAQQAYLKASNTGAGDLFGAQVAISGDTVVVGAHGENSNGAQSDNSLSNSGAAYVFVRSGAAWTQQAYLKASNPGAQDGFGTSVAISGNTVVVGANSESSSATGVDGDESNDNANRSGAAYVFVRSGTAWTQQAYLKASNTQAVDEFGFSVAISGDTVVVGALDEDSSATVVDGNQNDNSATGAGAAYVFVRNGSAWTQQAYLKASNAEALDNFGFDVAISEDTVVVGAWREKSNAIGVDGNQSDNSAPSAGAAYVFVRSGSRWAQQAYLKASNTGAEDHFGSYVAISGDTVVVGAIGEDSINGNPSDNSAADSGAAYVFVRSGTAWGQQVFLKASNTAAYDGFGRSVAISGDTVAIGASGEDSNAPGINGNQSNNTASGAGAVYLFTRNGSAWAQKAYLKASNPDAEDAFGNAVAISGDTVVVGALFEASKAKGINGNQSDDSASAAGAAYVFTGAGDPIQRGPSFVVNTLAERNDGLCGVSNCTLREALHAANPHSDLNTILFASGLTGTIRNSIPDGLPILNGVKINGPGARKLTISGNNSARIFNVAAGLGFVTIANLTLANGSAEDFSFPGNYGGAIFNAGSVSLSLLNCALVRNAAAHGGAIYNGAPEGELAGAQLSLLNCTFTENSVSGSGGAILNGGYKGRALVDAVNCTFDKNNAAEHGGAIYNDGTQDGNAELILTDCTFNQNRATLTGGGIVNDAFNDFSNFGTAKVTLRNTILRAGASGANLVNDGGTIESGGHNLSSDAAGATGADATTTGPAGFLNSAGDRRNTDPKLATLQNNGGPTDTVALLSDSPAINKGDDANTPETDQRGVPHVGVNDIGAFELSRGVIALSNATYQVNEGAGTITFNVVRSGGYDGAASAVCTTSNGSAQAGSDYTAKSATVSFANGEIAKTFTVAITNDAIDEANETFTVTLSNPTGGATLGTPLTRTATILDNEALPLLSISNVTVTEGNAGTINATFAVTLNKASGRTVTVNYVTADVTASVGSDYTAASGSLTFAPGQTSRTLNVAIKGDTVGEPNENFTVLLSGPVNATISDSQGVGTITDNDQPPGLVGNVSTRLPVGTGDNALFGGFIVQGPAGSTKKIMVRAIGPSLKPFGVPDALGNPTLEIKNANNVTVARNNDWKTTQLGGIITSNQAPEINSSGLAPGNDLESAIIANLAPGSYTAVVSGVGNTTGTGVVDAYDMSPTSPARLANVATRGLIQPGDKLMIGGFIIQNGPVRAVVRAIGPSLTAFGVSNALPDTTLELRNQNGVIVRENDNWQSDPAQKQELQSVGLQPSHNLEAAVIATLAPGQYTAQVRGKGQASGIGVVQIYFLQ